MTDTPVVALLLLLMSSNEANIPVSKFAPFGPENGDSLLPFGDDNCVGPISLKQNFTFFGRNRTELWLGTNGMIGFNSCAPIVDRNCQGSNASVEVFSADIYTISVGGLIYYKEETNIAALEAITNDMKSAFPEIGNVKLNWSFRATYINVTFYGVSSCLKYTNATFPRNSFQVILAGDGVNSFVIFHYDTISWVDIGVDLVCSNIGGYQARVGLFSEVGSYVMPGSCSSALKQISNNSNVEFPGKYVFKVDRNIVQQPTVKFCPMINPPQNGYANFTSTSIGSNIRFSCSSLYTLVGSESIKCQSDGSWSSIPPTCKKATSESQCFQCCFNSDGPQFTCSPSNPLKSSNESCGISAIVPQLQRIVGGTEAKPHSWPWMAAIMAKFGNSRWNLTCGGSLIADRWVLTAAHCFEGEKINLTNVKVILGAHDVTQVESTQQSFSIKKYFISPKRDSLSGSHDWCLIQLETTAKFTDNVNTICLASSTESLSEGTIGWATGWGLTESGNRETSAKLRQVPLPIVNFYSCNSAYEGEIDETMMCAGYEQGGRDSCQGDSGGPLVAKNSQQKWIQYGITSWGEGCAETGFPGVYCNISAVRHDIDEIMANN